MRGWRLRRAFLALGIALLALQAGFAAAPSPFVFIDTATAEWKPVEGVAGASWVPMRQQADGRIAAVVKFPAGAREKAHHHTHGHWIYVLEGAKKVENLTRGETHVLSEGMYLYTPAGDVHRIEYLSRCRFVFVTDGAFDMIWDEK